MPHYKDGTPAQVGDHVKGTPYNTNGKEIVGTVIQIAEDADSCNCIVAYVEPLTLTVLPPQLYTMQPFLPKLLIRVSGGVVKQNQTNGVEGVILDARYDYGALKDFVKA